MKTTSKFTDPNVVKGWHLNVNDISVNPVDLVRIFNEEVMSGANWYKALLKTISLWTIPSEIYNGRRYDYLINGEAFDWLSLADRICSELTVPIPDGQLEDLLFQGKFPEILTDDKFKELIGDDKHTAHLNYWYGVVVEEALHLAVEEEVRKHQKAMCLPDSEDLSDMSFVRIYEDTRKNLFAIFSDAKGYSETEKLNLTQLKEFTYWLFKRRLKLWDPARVASDTNKGLRILRALRQTDDWSVSLQSPTPTPKPTSTETPTLEATARRLQRLAQRRT